MPLMWGAPQKHLRVWRMETLGLGRIHVLVQGAVQVLNGKRHFRHLRNPPLGFQVLHQKGRSLRQVPCHILWAQAEISCTLTCGMVLDTCVQVHELLPKWFPNSPKMLLAKTVLFFYIIISILHWFDSLSMTRNYFKMQRWYFDMNISI